MTAHLPELPADLVMDPERIGKDYLNVLTETIANHPRSKQKDIGASEIGIPCARHVGYKLAGVKPHQRQQPNWKSTIGTAVHSWIENAFDQMNLHMQDANGGERWLVETRLTVGYVNGKPITGSCDLYDRWTGTVIDHKIIGPSQLDNYRRNGPSQQYRVQAHLYGLGWVLKQQRVTTVMIAFLPRHGELRDAHLWSEPFDPTIAGEALQRLTGIDTAISTVGETALALLPTADHWCNSCPWFKPGAQDVYCPGDPASPVNSHTGSQLNLIS